MRPMLALRAVSEYGDYVEESVPFDSRRARRGRRGTEPGAPLPRTYIIAPEATDRFWTRPISVITASASAADPGRT